MPIEALRSVEVFDRDPQGKGYRHGQPPVDHGILLCHVCIWQL